MSQCQVLPDTTSNAFALLVGGKQVRCASASQMGMLGWINALVRASKGEEKGPVVLKYIAKREEEEGPGLRQMSILRQPAAKYFPVGGARKPVQY
jgi:hypothetical protein